jgi:hypothetical protein
MKTEAIMFKVKADKEKNRLYITIGDIPEKDERELLIQEIESKIQALKQGFDCITDLREYEVQHDESETFIFRAQKRLTEAGMSNVVRIIKRFGSFAHFQFDKVSVAVGYHAQNAYSLEEAEAMLDSKKG